MTKWMNVLGVSLLALSGSAALAVNPVQRDVAVSKLQRARAGAEVYVYGERVSRVYGTTLASGANPVASAEQFLQAHADLFEIDSADLVPVSAVRDESDELPLMYDRETDSYRFTLVRYAQLVDGVPVFRADLRVLVRNEPGFPAVLASAGVRPMDGFTIEPGLLASANDATFVARKFTDAKAAARQLEPTLKRFTAPEVIIWAGVDDMIVTPRPALVTIGDDKEPGDVLADAKWLYVVDLETGTVLYEENQLLDVDVEGNVSALATEGSAAEQCGNEVSTPLPYAEVTTGATSTFADVNGDYVLPNAGAGSVNVSSEVRGEFFEVTNLGGAEALLQQSVTPPGPADFLHNPANTEFTRAEVNAYISANVVRDTMLSINPSYPTIGGQTGFGITVNEPANGFCPGNAQYQGDNLRFCAAGSDRPNTAWSSVVYHEYGHHLVAMGGSGQGAYGEGMSDSISTIVLDESETGFGFFISSGCNTPLRDADNTIQYPCSGAIHTCGQLISGCVWDTRNALLATNPVDYLDIIRDLTLNSVPLHIGSSITPQIAIDFLTLDDDDAQIGNGTPHRDQICQGFDAHSMTCPELLTGLFVSPLSSAAFEGPSGGPYLPASQVYTLQNLNPGAMSYSVSASDPWITVTNGSGSIPASGTADVTVSINGAADALADGFYNSTLDFQNLSDGTGTTSRPLALLVGERVVAYEWTLDVDPGWSRDGDWAFGTPLGLGSSSGDAPIAFTGTSVFGYNLAGDYGDNLGVQYLTAGPFDATGLSATTLRYNRWLGVESNSAFDDASVEVSNNGTSWTTVFSAAGTGASIDDAAWQQVEHDVAAVADNQPAVWFRWGMGPTDGSTARPGWNIDDVQIIALGGDVVPFQISADSGVPELLDPNSVNTLAVRVDERAQTAGPVLVTLHVRYDGGTFQTVAMSPLGNGIYEADFPPFGCSAVPQYYISASAPDTGTATNPPNAPGSVFTVKAVGTAAAVFTDDFDTDQGWTVSSTVSDGAWELGQPQGNDRADPPADFDGSGNCYLTDADPATTNSDVDNGTTTVTSPAFDLTDGGEISYAYWFNDISNGQLSAEDIFTVEVATNAAGTNWQTLRDYTLAADSWRLDAILVGSEIAASSTVRIRFTVGDEGSQNVVEAGLDDVVVRAFSCAAAGTCIDGVLNQDEDRIDCGGSCSPCTCTDDASCGDGIFCNGIETCDGFGECGVALDLSCPSSSTWCRESDGACVAFGGGDFNGDGDIDLEDAAAFAVCFDAEAEPGCEAANLTGSSGQVDLDDYLIFSTRLSGGGPQ